METFSVCTYTKVFPLLQLFEWDSWRLLESCAPYKASIENLLPVSVPLCLVQSDFCRRYYYYIANPLFATATVKINKIWMTVQNY